MASTNATRAAPACADNGPLEDCYAWRADTSTAITAQAKTQARLNAEREWLRIQRKHFEITRLRRP